MMEFCGQRPLGILPHRCGPALRKRHSRFVSPCPDCIADRFELPFAWTAAVQPLPHRRVQPLTIDPDRSVTRGCDAFFSCRGLRRNIMKPSQNGGGGESSRASIPDRSGRSGKADAGRCTPGPAGIPRNRRMAAGMTKCARRKNPALHRRCLTLIALLPAEATMPDWVNCQQGVT